MDKAQRLITAADFKANCLRLMDEVAQRRTPVDIFGRMAGTIRICGDIVGPTSEDGEWTGDAENIRASDAPARHAYPALAGGRKRRIGGRSAPYDQPSHGRRYAADSGNLAVGNRAAVVIELFWAAISLYGLAKSRRPSG